MVQRAFDLNPDVAQLQSDSADTLVWLGRYQDVVARAELGPRMLKVPPQWMYWSLGWAEYNSRNYEKSLVALYQMANSENPWRADLLAAAYARLGRMEDAARARHLYLTQKPNYSIASVRKHWKDCFKVHPEDLEHWLEGLRKAGFPE
jgi:hypothetical protein